MTMRSSFTPPVILFHLFLHASPPSALSFQSISSVKSFPIKSIHLAARRNTHSSLIVWHQRHRHRQRLPFLPTTAVMMSTSTSQSNIFSSSILGGDYAGLSATFSPKSGELVPVPEHLVPESMIEWGQIPSSLETLSSEDWIGGGDTDSMKELERTTISVLPEVGCGIDNLEVTKQCERFGQDVSRLESWQHQQPEREVVAVDRRSQKLDMETIFQIDSVVDEDGKTCPRRIRVSLSIDIPKETEDPALSKLISLQVERQSSPQSTQGMAWSGPSSNSGGLDARSVMNTIGKDIVYGDVFQIKGGGDPWDLVSGTEEKDEEVTILDKQWMQDMISPDNDNDNVGEVQRREGGLNGDENSSIVTIRLPQNIMVRYGYGVSDKTNTWAIEVSHFNTIVVDGKTRLQRRISLRSLGIFEPVENDICNDSSLGDISYWIEERQ
mmetsp:Transcript_20879/g.38311  ORF Transcript_20879/g.38311 Transcript_20879/m.38311 type:complete len:439 (-) Transcript_20879:71-1387(-)